MKYSVLFLFTGFLTGAVAENCDNPRDDFDELYCLSKIYIETDDELNEVYSELRSLVGNVEREDLRERQLKWIEGRNSKCGSKKDDQFYVDLSCLKKMTEKQISVLRKRLRECKSVGCDLDAQKDRPRIGPFKASYYRESGNRLVASETVVRPSINYSYNGFHDIGSKNFYATWEGDVDLGEGKHTLIANFDASWSETAYYVDDNLILSWKNSNKTIPVNLDSGAHRIRIEHHNNWHTVGFNASFVSYPVIPAADATDVLSKIINRNTAIIYVGAYESSDTHNEVFLSIPKMNKSIFVFLSSYESVNWVLDEASSPMVEGVVVSGGNSSTVSGTVDAAPVYRIDGLVSGYKNPGAIKSKISQITGKEPAYVFGEYSISSVVIPTM